MTVPLVEAASRVAMDTSFHLNDYFSDPPTLRHKLPSSSIVDEINAAIGLFNFFIQIID